MRERFLNEFDEITIDSLNGDKFRTGKLTPDGKPDPSVFSTESNREGIQVGTAIALCVRDEPHHAPATVRFRDLWGTAKHAELALEAQTGNIGHYQTVTPDLNLGLIFRPTNTSADYGSWPLLTELFPVSFPGIKTSRDSVVVDIDRDRLEARMKMYFDPSVSFERLKLIIPEATEASSGFNPEEVRAYLLKRGYRGENLISFLYRPFDLRCLYWEQETKLLDRTRVDARSHYFLNNFWIAACQQNRKKYSPPLVSRTPASLHIIERGANLFPMLLRDINRTLYENEQGTSPNVTSKVTEYLQQLGLEVGDVFHHSIAVMHAPSYATENAAALRQGWPRIPLPAVADLLSASAKLGRQVADLLDTDSSVDGVTTGAIRPELRALAVISTVARGGQLNPAKDLKITAKWGHYGKDNAVMPAKGKTIIREYSPEELKAFGSSPEALSLLGERTIDIYLNDVAYWRNVPEHVWEYTIGGYQVLKKWLSYRESKILQRPLRVEETKLFTEITRRIAALLLLSPALDANYEAVRADTRKLL